MIHRIRRPVAVLGLPSLALLLALALLGLATAGCTPEGNAMENKPDDAPEKKKKEELVPVEAVALEHGPIEAVLRFTTNLEAESEVSVYSQAARLVTELHVEEGAQVRKGNLLVRLQDAEQRSALARAESQRDRARREHQRQKNLFERQLIPEQAFNDSTYELEQLELAVTDSERELGYTEVRAPINGTVTRRLVNLGDNVTVNQHLFDIVDFDTIVARVYVPEKDRARLAVGQPARIFSSSLGASGDSVGRVKRIAPVVDPQSGTVKVTVSVPRQSGLVPGMYVEAELVIATLEDALLVPKRAVVYDDNRAFVFRLDGDMKVQRLEIEPLLMDKSSIQPAPGVVEAGDRILVAGQSGLKSGAKVRIAGEKEEPEEDEDAGENASGDTPE